MTQTQKARLFASYHQAGNPLVLFNIWDAGSAKAVAESGARALATGSWSMAAAQGFPDGEAIPFDWVEKIVARIAATMDLPLTVDFEGGYADDDQDTADHAERIVAAGAIGINFEDGIVGSKALRDIQPHCRRIEAIRTRAEKLGIDLFINARTDLFLNANRTDHAALCPEAIMRAEAYRSAGASGFFAPGLIAEDLIVALSDAVKLPLNIMMMSDAPSVSRLAELGVKRVSYGPMPYSQAMGFLKQQAASALV